MSFFDKEISSINLNQSGGHFFHLYKNENKINEFRIQVKNNINELRQKNRQNNFDINRTFLIPAVEDKALNNCFYRKSMKSKNNWANLMMLAEWFLLVPESFSNSYLMKFCPYGRHVLLVSHKRVTRIYTKNGILLDSFKSFLPGGGLENSEMGSNKSSIFDCIYNKETNKIYFLDIIYYMRQDFRDMAAEDRFNWLDNYFKSEMSSGTQFHDYSFEVLNTISCFKENLTEFFQSSAPCPLDGLLFYARNDPYTSGSTYSAMWLKPYMVPELLSIELHPDYMANMPMDYATYRDDIIQYNEKYGWKENDNPESSEKEDETS